MDNVTIEDLEALRADNRGDILTIYQQGNRRDKEVSVKDYIMSKIKELDRYSVDVNCHTVEVIAKIDSNGEYVRFEDIIHMFNKGV